MSYLWPHLMPVSHTLDCISHLFPWNSPPSIILWSFKVCYSFLFKQSALKLHLSILLCTRQQSLVKCISQRTEKMVEQWCLVNTLKEMYCFALTLTGRFFSLPLPLDPFCPPIRSSLATYAQQQNDFESLLSMRGIKMGVPRNLLAKGIFLKVSVSEDK